MKARGEKMNSYNEREYQENRNMTAMKNTIAGANNNNFNKCNYIQQVTPNDLYSAYAGFIRGNMYPDLYNQYKMNKRNYSLMLTLTVLGLTI